MSKKTNSKETPPQTKLETEPPTPQQELSFMLAYTRIGITRKYNLGNYASVDLILEANLEDSALTDKSIPEIFEVLAGQIQAFYDKNLKDQVKPTVEHMKPSGKGGRSAQREPNPAKEVLEEAEDYAKATEWEWKEGSNGKYEKAEVSTDQNFAQLKRCLTKAMELQQKERVFIKNTVYWLFRDGAIGRKVVARKRY